MPAEWLAHDVPFRDPTSLLITPDHYVNRLLHAHGVVRRHTEPALQIAGQDRRGDWLVVALIEDSDDVYIVASARYLDDEEVDTVSGVIQ